MKTIVWVARHPMAPQALVDLKKTLAVDGNVSIKVIHPTWMSTSDAESDVRRNSETWLMLADLATSGEVGDQPVVAGIFPPAALEALFETDFSGFMSPRVLTPVCRPSASFVDELAVPVDVNHLRWVQLASMA